MVISQSGHEQPPPRRLRQWVDGVSTPSLGALAGALLVVAALFISGALLVTPKVMANRSELFAANSQDEFAFVTAHALKIASAPATGLSVTVIGDSSLREAITSPEVLARLVSLDAGRPIVANLLAAGGLNHFDEVALSDLLRDHLRGVILLEISPNALNWSRPILDTTTLDRLGFKSRTLDHELRMAGVKRPHRVGNYFLDNYQFFAARSSNVTHLFNASCEARQHLIDESGRWSDTKWKREGRKIVGWEQHFGRFEEANLDVYRRMIDRLRRNPALRVGLIETVENPRAQTQWAGFARDRTARARYKADLIRLAESDKVPILGLVEEAELRPDDFIDYIHVYDSGARARFTRVLAHRVANLLAGLPDEKEKSL
ncbi:MAG: hypothetical protein JWN40_3031 [Phycisphaerales bacterium]|nr:hypothetical protein [Phycisphaerales bacterium]